MLPKTLSASAGQVYEGCPARFSAEYDGDRARSVTGQAAGVGIVCHSALEAWVTCDHHVKPPPNAIEVMKDLYDAFYWTTFGDTKHYNEGLKLCQSWRARQDWSGRTVLSAERRDRFPLMTTAGPIPFVFVMDRMDRLDSDRYEVEVVDYKTVSVPITPDQLHDRIQARAYAVAAQIMHPEADRIWVSFDLLRFDQTVGTVFTREENRENWRYLAKLAQRIVDDNEPEERLNPECRWCVRKHECKQLLRHASAGGALSITDPIAAAEMRFELDNAKRGIEGRISDLDELLLGYCEREELLEFDAGAVNVEVTARRSRSVDAGRAAPVLGPEIMLRHTDLKISTVDALLKGTEITDEQKAALKALIRSSVGEPKVKVTAKK